MTKKAYIGVDGVARKIKTGYVGIATEFTIYEDTTVNATITTSNIADYFTITNDTYYFGGSSGTFTSNNNGVDSSTATSTWTAKLDISAISFDYSVSSESGYDKLTISVGSTTVASAISGTKSSSWSGSLSKGDTITLAYSKDSSSNSGSDCGTISNIAITATIQSLVGTEIKEVARKIKKAYIGIGGVARPCWGGGELTYYGTATELSVGRRDVSATTVGDFALFGGGNRGNSNYYDTVDAYDKSLTQTAPTALNEARGGAVATTVGDFALFGGGYSTNYSSKVDAYDKSLTRTIPTALKTGANRLAATTVGGFALFGGGYSYGGPTDIVNAYNTSLTRTTPTPLSIARSDLAATTVGDFALFGGGDDDEDHVSTVNAYNKSLTRTTPTSLSTTRGSLAATTVGGFALFGGGINYTTITSAVDVYDTSLTKGSSTYLSTSSQYLAATTVGDFALFGGGDGDSTTYLAVVTSFDTSLTRTKQNSLSVERGYLAATTVGDFALFGGGYGSGYQSAVDVYAIV